MAKITPSVRAYALRHNIDIDELTGSGAAGYITNRDVDAAAFARSVKPGSRGVPLPYPQPSIGSSAISQDPNAMDYFDRPRAVMQRYKSFMDRHEALANRGRMDFSGGFQPFDSSIIDNTQSQLAKMGINVSRKQVELFPQWGKEDVLSVRQSIRGKTTESYIAFGPTGGTYLANPDNLGGLRPVLGYVGQETNGQYLSPAQRIGNWINNQERSLMGHAQFEGAEWVGMQRIEAQPGLDRLYASGIQFGGRGMYDSDRRALMSRFNRDNDTDYSMFQGVSSAYRVSDYRGVVPTSANNEMLISKLKRVKLWTGKVSGASLGVGTDLAQDYEPFYFQGQSGPNKSTVFREAFDLFSEHPEGASFANRLFARNEFTKTLSLSTGAKFDASTGQIVLGDGTTVGANSYFGRNLGMVDETMSRAGGMRDFENVFGVSGRSYTAMAIQGLQPEMDDQGAFTGRVQVRMSGYTPEYADKYASKEEPMTVNASYLPTDASGRTVDFWRRMPDAKELPAVALQTFKAEMGTTQAAREAFLDYATDQGVSFMDARKMFSEEGVVSGEGTELLTRLAVDRFKSGFQYHERSNVTLSQSQYDALAGQKFSYQGNEYDVLGDVKQNDNGTYNVGTFRTMRRFADVATNLRSEHTRDQMLVKPGAMSVMAQYRPDVFDVSAQMANQRLARNSSYNIVASYRANYSPETRSQLESVFGGVAQISPDEINQIRSGIREANPDYNADQMLQSTLGALKEQYGRRALEVAGPQGSMVLPSAGAILGNLTESKERTLINNWARMAGESVMLTGDQTPEGQQQLGGLLARLSNPEDKESLAYHANLQGVLEKAVGFHQPTVGGLARAIPNLGMNEAVMSMRHAMKVTGIDDPERLRELAGQGSLGTAFRYPWSDPTDQFANPTVKFYEDLPKDSPIRQNFPNPGQGIYTSNEIMMQLHGDVDGDRIGMMLNVLDAGKDRIVGGVLGATGDPIGSSKKAFESEYYKYLETMRERSGSFEGLMPEKMLPTTSDELRQQFEVEEGQARSHLGKVYNALLRQMGGSVNPSTEGMFGAQHPLTRLVADSVGDINSYGIQSFVDRSAQRDTAFESVMGSVYRGKRGFRQRNPDGKYEDVATGANDFYQKKFQEVMKIGGNLKGEGFEDYAGPGNAPADMEYRAKLAPAIATSMISRRELSSLYEQGGEEAVGTRVNAMADMLTEMRTTGNYSASKLLPMTGASSFSEWGLGTDDLDSMSPMAEYITGKIQLSHYDNLAKTQGQGAFAESLGGASAQAGEAALQSRDFRRAVDKPELGLEAMVSNKGGPAALRGWINKLLPGSADRQSFSQRMQTVPAMQQMAQNLSSGGIPIPGISIPGNVPASGGGIPIPNLSGLFDSDDPTAFANALNETMRDPGKQDYSNIPIDMNLANDIAQRIGGSGGGKPPTTSSIASAVFDNGGGGGGRSGGSSGGGGSNIYHYNTSQPHISEETLAKGAKALKDLTEQFGSLGEVVNKLTDSSSEYQETLIDTYENMTKVVNYGRGVDAFKGKGGAFAETTDYQLYKSLFSPNQIGVMNEFVEQMRLPVAQARMGMGGEEAGMPLPEGWQETQTRLKRDFQAGVAARQKEFDAEPSASIGERALSGLGDLGNRLIHGQGLWRAKMAYGMFADPMFGMANDYLSQQSMQGLSLLQTGQISYGELMQGQFGTTQRRRAGLQEAQLAVGAQSYAAYSPLINFAMGRDGGASILGMAAGIGLPAFGVGVGVTSLTGNAALGVGAGALTGAIGLGQYALSNSTNYAAMGQVQASRGGKNLERGGVLGSVIGDILQNPEGAFGAIGAGIRHGLGQMPEEEWQRVINSQYLYEDIQQYVGGQFNRQGAIDDARQNGFSAGDVITGAQEEFLRRQAAQGVSRDISLPTLQYFQMYNPDEFPQGQNLQNMTIANLSGANSVGAIQAYAQSMGVGSTNQGGMANVVSGILGSIAQGRNPVLTAQFIQQNAGIVSGSNQLLRQAGLLDLQLNVDPSRMSEEEYQRATQDVEYMPMRSQERSARAQLRFAAPEYYDEFKNRLFDPLNNEIQTGNYLGATRRQNQILASANLYSQASTFSYENAGELAAMYGGMTNTQQIGIMDAITSGNRLVISQQANRIGRPDLRTINTQTGMGITYQDLDAGAINMVRSQDRYGYTAGVTDEQLAKGTAGLQNDIRLIQEGEMRYQRGMQIQGNLLEMTSRYGGAANMNILRGIGAQYGVQMDSRIGRGYRELEDAGIAINRMQQDWGMAQQAAGLNISQRQFETSGRQWYESYNLNQRQFQYNTAMQAQEMQLNREQQLLSQGYQREDLAFNRAQSNLNFAWQMEDYNRNIRYARGREKRDLMREKKRAVIRFGMQSGQMQKQENRLETSIEYQNKEFALKKDQFEQSIKFRQEEFDLQKRHFEENRQFERERMQLQTQNHQMQLQFMREERRLQDEQLLLNRYMQDVNTQMSLQMQQRAYEVQMQVLQLTNAIQGMGMAVSQVNSLIDVMKFQIAYLYGMATTGGSTATRAPIYTPGSGAYMTGGTTPGRTATEYADGGYTGDGYKYEAKGIVHAGEYVVPQEGALVLKEDDKSIKLLERMVQLLQIVADNPTSFQAVIDGVKSPTTSVYQQSKARL